MCNVKLLVYFSEICTSFSSFVMTTSKVNNSTTLEITTEISKQLYEHGIPSSMVSAALNMLQTASNHLIDDKTKMQVVMWCGKAYTELS